MELLNKIEEFLKVENGYGDGSGYGSGDGDGYADGDGSGYGSGDGDGYGSDYGDGSGDGYGSGSGYGDGYGDGYGSGYGDGYGYGSDDGDGYRSGSKIKSINKEKIYGIDNIPTIITYVKGNIAKGKILQKDLTFEKCYIVKGQNQFAHGKTLKEAMEDLKDKIFENIDVDERISEFWKVFNDKDKYTGKMFYDWHKNLTGSCRQGRENFVRNHNLSLRKKYTVKEFVDLCKNDYGGEIIQRLEER